MLHVALWVVGWWTFTVALAALAWRLDSGVWGSKVTTYADGRVECIETPWHVVFCQWLLRKVGYLWRA